MRQRVTLKLENTPREVCCVERVLDLLLDDVRQAAEFASVVHAIADHETCTVPDDTNIVHVHIIALMVVRLGEQDRGLQ